MFEKYLTEAKKVYEFSIGVAGQLPEGFEDSLETALKRYSIETMGAITFISPINSTNCTINLCTATTATLSAMVTPF